jgi:hypothetical protein
VSNNKGGLSREAFQQEVRKELDSFRTQVVDGLAKLSEAFKDASPDMLANAAALLKNQPVTAAPSVAVGSTETKPPIEKKNWLVRLWNWTKDKVKTGWNKVKTWSGKHPFITAAACGVATGVGIVAIALAFPVMNASIPIILMTVLSGVIAGVVLDPEEDPDNNGPVAILAYVAAQSLVTAMYGMSPLGLLILAIVSIVVVASTKGIAETKLEASAPVTQAA